MENINPMKKAEEVASVFLDGDERFDPSGSYTGTSTDEDITPVQDADDL